jgi:15-cis-phytoene desaturase
MAFLDGNQPERVCAPMKAHIEARGGEVKLNSPVREILTNADGSVAGLAMRDGSTVTADMYVLPHRG